MAGSFLAPFLYALYSKRVTTASCWACFVFAVCLTTANAFGWKPVLWPGTAMNPIHAGAFAMLAGLVIVPAVSLFTPKPRKDLVDGAFACYDKTTLVRQSTALGAETIK